MSAANENWFLPEQPDGVIAQLNAGIRVFLVDSWYGQTTTRPGLVATAQQDYAAALQTVRDGYGQATVQAAPRLRKALLPQAVGPPTPYLCHGLCELGATAWEPLMVQVREWMAGLVPYAYTPEPGKPWPTLGKMIDSGKRLVVMMQRHGGGARAPWLLQGFD